MHPSLLNLYTRNRQRGHYNIAPRNDGSSTTVYLYDMIVDTRAETEWWGGVSAEAFVQDLAAITTPIIHLRVNSPGGSVFAGRAMEQAIRQHSATVIAHVDGLAASAASFLIMPANEIQMAPGSFLMIHKAWTWTAGNADDLRKQAGVLDQIDQSLVDTYARRTGLAAQELADMMAAETWIEARRAVEQGFANAVTEDDPAPAQASIAWDLSPYTNGPGRQPPQQHRQPPTPPAHQPDRAALQLAALRACIPPA